MSDATELPVPAEVRDGQKAVELVRVWLVDGNQIVTISPSLWDDPATWGLLLVDLANHVASAYAVQGLEKEAVLTRIKRAFDAEWDYPTA